jgi:hypothetical protein
MARGAVPINAMIRTAPVTYTNVVGDPLNGHYLSDPGNCVLHVFNTGGTPHTVSFVFARTFDGAVVPPKAVAIPGNQRLYFSGWEPAFFFQEQDLGRLYVDVSNAALALGAFRMPTLR